MYNKMEETKKSVVLFHEALKSLKIPHAISGFWEDASSAKPEDKPNVIHEVVNYKNSTLPNVGPKLCNFVKKKITATDILFVSFLKNLQKT